MTLEGETRKDREPRAAAQSGRLRPRRMAVLLIILSIISGLMVLGAYEMHLHQVKAAIFEQNNLRKMALADQVREYFVSVYLYLHSATAETGLLGASRHQVEEAEKIFRYWNQEWKVTRLLVVPRDYDGTNSPALSIPGADTGQVSPELRGVLLRHLKWFSENPESRAQISTVPSAQRSLDLCYSIPITADNGALSGVASALIPGERIAEVLGSGGPGTLAFIVNEDRVLIPCNAMPPNTLAWFETRFKNLGTIAFFERVQRAFPLDGWMTTNTSFLAPYGKRDRWWIVFQYDEAAHLAISGAGTPVFGILAALSVAIGGCFFAFLVYLYLDGVSKQHEMERREHQLESQLRQAHKMEAVGRLAGGIAHDFNNLLQAILGHGSLASEAIETTHPARENLNEILKAGERATALTRQLLTFSRCAPYTLELLCLNGVVSDLMKMLSRLLGENIEIEFLPEDKLATIQADQGQIQQILMNLFVNARDAMPNGGKLVVQTRNAAFDASFCQLHPWARQGNFVWLSVSDTGVGIPTQVRDRIFEPFFTTKDAGRGTGLGLATVYALVQQHKGFISLYSEEGQGTSFNLYFPVADILQTQATSTQRTQAVGPGTGVILYAEDEETVRQVMTTVLKAAGYTVFSAADGEEAIRWAASYSGSLDLAVLDAIMPKMGGKEAAAFLRAKWPDLPVLFCSGYSGYLVELFPQGTPHMRALEKPFVPSALVSAVHEMLHRNELKADA